MINEANSVLYVDPTLTKARSRQNYIYDIKNNTTLFDYGFESADKVSPNDSRTIHLGKIKA